MGGGKDKQGEESHDKGFLSNMAQGLSHCFVGHDGKTGHGGKGSMLAGGAAAAAAAYGVHQISSQGHGSHGQGCHGYPGSHGQGCHGYPGSHGGFSHGS